MSSYRSYVPWKSVNSTSSYSPKSETSSSRYSSRDDITSPDHKTSATSSVRFGSLASPSSYRPSYSGGTYRSMKRDPPSTTTSSSSSTPYTSKYGTSSSALSGTSNASSTAKDAKDKEAETKKTTPTPLNKYRIRTSSTSASTGTATPSATTDSLSKRYNGATTSLGVKPLSIKSRDPSPSGYLSVRTRDTLKSRDTSPTTPGNFCGSERSRDPSPATGDRFSQYRLNLRTGGSSTDHVGASKRAPVVPATAGLALSYLTASDATARCVSRRTKREEEKIQTAEANSLPEASNDAEECSSSSEPTEMVEVQVVTRGTSPNPPPIQSASSYVRSRRMECAKTIEKTIYRPAKKPQMIDREMQSDRLDDSTKYLRFGSTRISPWSYVESKYSATANGFSSAGSRYGSGTTNGKGAADSAVEDAVKPVTKAKDSPPKVAPLTRSNSIKTNSARFETAKSKSKSPIKSTAGGSTTNLSSKKSLDNGTGTGSSRPPQAPKTELSPTKTVSSSTGSFKWTNKDFRKSALNVGPTDRPRKLTSSSTATSTPASSEPSSPLMKRSERAASTSSEASSSSCTTSSSSKTKATTTTATTSEDEKPLVTVSKTSSSMVTASSGEKSTMPNIQSLRISDDDDDEETIAATVTEKPSKSFLSRAFEPVTNLFKSKSHHQRSPTPVDTEATSYCVDELNSTSSSSQVESLPKDMLTEVGDSVNSPDLSIKIGHRLRHIDSGEAASWWDNTEEEQESTTNMTADDDNDDTIADDLTLNSTIEPAPPPLPQSSRFSPSPKAQPHPPPAVKNFYRIKRIESGEKAWWMEDSPPPAQPAQTAQTAPPTAPTPPKEDSPKPKFYRIRPIESGERAWWLDNSNDISSTSADGQTNEKNDKTGDLVTAQPQDTVDAETTVTITLPSKARNSTQSPAELANAATEKTWWSRNTDNEDDSGRATSELTTASAPVQPSQSAEARIGSPDISVRCIPMRIQHADSGELPWWMQSNDDDNDKSTSTPLAAPNSASANNSASNATTTPTERHQPPAPVIPTTAAVATRSRPNSIIDMSAHLHELGDRASPEGVEAPATSSSSGSAHRPHQLFISRHTNIDDLLGGGCHQLSPLMDDRRFEAPMSSPSPVPGGLSEFDSVFQRSAVLSPSGGNGLDDAALQVYKDGDFGSYLDLESSLVEQSDEVEGLHTSRKNSLVVRTQLSVRVHAIIEKLLTTQGRDLRRALFSLKQIFQEDKDLVHGFVALGGLNCLVSVGNDADQNYQNYILRAMGQVMLYVDGMNGVMRHAPSIRWLYSLIASKFRLVVKTALKLLLVFVEYVEGNCMLLVNAVHAEDAAFERTPWTNIMNLLKDYDNADTELLIYGSTLINKTLSGLSDQDSFYDESDYLEQQGMEGVVQRYMSRPGTDLDLLDQLQLYEAVLKFEDGESDGIRIPDNSVRKTLRQRTPNASTANSPYPGLDSAHSGSGERRKSRRHSTGNSPLLLPPPIPPHPKGYAPNASMLLIQQTVDEDSSSSGSNSMEPSSPGDANAGGLPGSGSVGGASLLGGAGLPKVPLTGAGVTPGLRRRRERAERQKTFMREQQDASARALEANREESNNHGQIVTAIPVRLQNIPDAPEPGHSDATDASASVDTDRNDIQQKISALRPTHLDFLGSRLNGHQNNRKFSSDFVPKTPPPPLPPFDINANEFRPLPAVLNGHQNHKSSSIPNSTIGAYVSTDSQSPTIRLTAAPPIVAAPPPTPPPPLPAMLVATKIPADAESTSACDKPKDFYTSYAQPNTEVKVMGLTPRPSALRRHNRRFSQKITGQDLGHGLEELQKMHSMGNGSGLTSSRVGLAVNENNSLASNGSGSNSSSPTSIEMGPNDLDIATSDYLTDEHDECGEPESVTSLNDSVESEEKRLLLQLKRDHTVKDLTQKLSNMPLSPSAASASGSPGGNGLGTGSGTDCVDKLAHQQRNLLISNELTGLISKAKEGLEKSKSKGDITRSASMDQTAEAASTLTGMKKLEPKKSENELHWEELVSNMQRPLQLCDLDFTDLQSDDDKDELAPRGLVGMIPPPPPPIGMASAAGVGRSPPPPMMMMGPPAPLNLMGPPPPLMNMLNMRASPLAMNGPSAALNGNGAGENGAMKTKKTVKLFWKEVREDCMPTVSTSKTIWDELPEAQVDVEKLEHLFESRAKDLISKKQQELNKNKEIIVLDHKRSNAINIAMTKLPPPRAIKAAILKMDATVVTREGIEKLQNMLPTDEERGKIQEAQVSNPELPLGSAEQFLLTLSSISELAARLKLWAFKLDFENSEKEIAEPLMDLKQGLQSLQANRTFRCILATLRSIGIFLNGAPVKGFQIEYLAKVPEVKDTVHKHSLLHHLCHMVMENAPDTTDLYSEIGAVTRTSKTDFADLAHQITSLETECKASWDRLKLIAKHDCPPQLKQRLVDFLADCAERIILLGIIHRRVVNRYRKFLIWLGVPQHRILESRPNEVCRIVSEFALEYRTTRERVQQQIEKKANHRERNKTRGKMIIDVDRFRTKEDKADAELRHILGSPGAASPTLLKNAIESPTTITWPRRRSDNLRSPNPGAMQLLRQHQHGGAATPTDEHAFADGDDEILESLVKTATKTSGSRPATRERKRTRHADRKSLRRTLKNGISEEERQTLAAFMTK